MARVVGIGHQDFGKLVESNNFYIDKTTFIKEWWENNDDVTLLARPRRFGKTLTMSMVEYFFSVKYAERGDLFGEFSIWQEEKYRKLQGTYPVISLSFANIKECNYRDARRKICQLIVDEYARNSFLAEGNLLAEQEKDFFNRVTVDMGDVEATLALNRLSEYLCRYHRKKVIILLDEYDTPMQEAYVCGYWQEMVEFIRSLFNAAFKTNPYLGRALMTGITRISKESIFSDLNNLTVVTTTSDMYADSFGFTENEVYSALSEYGLSNKMEQVKYWYDGFVFGSHRDIYNPWSIINFLKFGKLSTYWANTSSNNLIGKLIREGSKNVKIIMEDLLSGRKLCTQIEEQIVFGQLDQDEDAIWSLFLACGYLKADKYTIDELCGSELYELSLTNKEVHIMFGKMIKGWFARTASAYNDFIKALLLGDLEAMNKYMNRVAEEIFSFFDTGTHPSKKAEPERFYHGFVLGLLVDLADRYVITSNRESGYGRYDILLEPLGRQEDENINNSIRGDAIIIEFKVHDPEGEGTLQDTVAAALQQIEKKQYARVLKSKGIAPEKIRCYGFAFEGKKVLIG